MAGVAHEGGCGMNNDGLTCCMQFAMPCPQQGGGNRWIVLSTPLRSRWFLWVGVCRVKTKCRKFKKEKQDWTL